MNSAVAISTLIAIMNIHNHMVVVINPQILTYFLNTHAEL